MGKWRNLVAIAAVTLGTGCGGGGEGGADLPPPPPPSYMIGGTVTGLTGSGLVVQNNSASDLAVPPGATGFVFPGSVGAGAGYNVTVKAQPVGPSATCSVANGTGTATANVSVAVSCTVNSFAVGGTIAGLVGTGLTLQLNGGTPMAVAGGSAAFAFQNVASGTGYSVTVGTQPSSPAQTCTVTNGSGTVGAVSVANIAVNCVTVSYTVGGAIAGLAGAGLVLQNNGSNDLVVAAGATSFTFAAPLAPGTSYNVTIKSQPTGPAQTCTIANGAGTAAATVTNVVVNCVTNTSTVGGTVAGLVGTGLSLLLNGGAPLSVPAGATAFTFPSPVAPGSNYAVTVAAHPTGPGQTCAVGNGTGAVGAGNVTNVAVTCTTNPANTWTVGGTITGLTGLGLVLKLNGNVALTVPAGATGFAFPAVASGTPYAVTVGTQPAGQTCLIGGGSGTVGSANVTNVAVTCTVNAYTVGGTISGLTGNNLNILLNGGSRQVVPPGTTAFTFAGKVTTGAAFTVTVNIQPSNPTQACTVANGTGTMGSANVTNVVITCVATFTIGGTVGPNLLRSNGLVLLLNGGSPIVRGVDQPNFTFPGLPSGTPYSVTVGTQPAAPPHTCTVSNGSGTVGAANITNVQVNCIPDGMIIGGVVQGYSGTGLTLGLKASRGEALLPAEAPLQPQSQGKYAFRNLYQPDDEYAVFIVTQPPGQTCTILQATGRVPTLAQNQFGGLYVATGKVKCINNVTSPLSGVYSVLNGTHRSYLAFWPDGTFVVAARSDDPSCPDSGNGIEYGVYNYNAATNALAILDVPLDTDGACGLADPAALPPPGTLTKSGNTITISTAGGPITLTAVTSTPGTLIGAFGIEGGFDGRFLVFQTDNTYLLADPQGANSYGLGTRPGYERACYSAGASTLTVNVAVSCVPDGAPVVDTNGKSGFSDAGGPVPFAITGPNGISIDGLRLVRLLP